MMKAKWMFLFVWIFCQSTYSQKLKPYTLGAEVDGTIFETAALIKESLRNNGFEIVGNYHPMEKPDRMIIAYTSSEILTAVKSIGGLSGFASAWRIGLDENKGKVIISFNTPDYWGNAYFRNDFKKVAHLYDAYKVNIEKVFQENGGYLGESFGSKKGLDPKRLAHYRYKVLMPQFEDTHVVGKFASFEEATATIEKNLKKPGSSLVQVYSVQVPGTDIRLYGIGLEGKDGESKFLPKIDIEDPQHTPFLPYELLVKGNEVHMLHGRFRIALSFPDLSMGTFMKIVSTPGDIKEAMESLCQELL